MKYPRLTLALAGLLIGSLLAAQEKPQAQAPPPKPPIARPSMDEIVGAAFNPGPPPDPAAVQRGQQIFQPTCGFCHGEDATGKSGPDLVRSPLVIKDDGGELIGPVIREGRPTKGMPAFAAFTDQQISDISAFLHSRVRAAANRFAYSFQQVVTGNAQAGAAYFNGTGKCNTCHSPTGDLGGVATRYQPADLQANMLYPRGSFMDFGSRRPRPPTQVALTLASGETVTGTLVSRDAFTVAIKDAAGWYRSFPAPGTHLAISDPLAAHNQVIQTISDAEMHDLLAYLETLK